METLITIVNLFILAGILVYVLEKTSRSEKARYREFVKSMMTDNLQEYSETLDDDNDPIIEEEDEIVELGEMEEDQLIKRLNEEHDN